MFKLLNNLQFLESLDVSRCEFVCNESIVPTKRNCFSLLELNFAQSNISNEILVEILQKTPLLQFLNLAGTKVEKSGIEKILFLDKLESLNMSFCDKQVVECSIYQNHFEKHGKFLPSLLLANFVAIEEMKDDLLEIFSKSCFLLNTIHLSKCADITDKTIDLISNLPIILISVNETQITKEKSISLINKKPNILIHCPAKWEKMGVLSIVNAKKN